jgi:predicted dehydrogenase
MVFDVLAEAAQQTSTELGVKIARSVDEVLSAGDVGGVLVATSTDTHVPLIMAAVRAGKAVFCEKPVDLDLQRARACWSEIAGNKPRGLCRLAVRERVAPLPAAELGVRQCKRQASGMR